MQLTGLIGLHVQSRIVTWHEVSNNVNFAAPLGACGTVVSRVLFLKKSKKLSINYFTALLPHEYYCASSVCINVHARYLVDDRHCCLPASKIVPDFIPSQPHPVCTGMYGMTYTLLA